MINHSRFASRDSFTLIELLVVIAIVAVLSVVVILVINPVQLLKQARDSNRISDMDTLTRGVQLYEVQALVVSPGNASTTYFSLVDPAATSTSGTNCAGVGGLTPPSGWTYHCAASSSVKKVDGTGWLPVDFTTLSSRPFGVLPIDPVNTSSSGYYYSYTPGGSFAVTATLESDKYLTTKAKDDGGFDPGRIEQGSDLRLIAQSQGLAAWWKFDEGAGTSASDASGNSNNATMVNSPTWQSADCKSGKCLSFLAASTQYLTFGTTNFSFASSGGSILVWVKTSTTTRQDVLAYGSSNNGQLRGLTIDLSLPGQLYFQGYNRDCNINTLTADDGNWHQIGYSYNGATTVTIWLDGAGQNCTLGAALDTVAGIGQMGVYAGYFNGSMDEPRVYSRPLTAKEVEAMYTATR